MLHPLNAKLASGFQGIFMPGSEKYFSICLAKATASLPGSMGTFRFATRISATLGARVAQRTVGSLCLTKPQARF